MVHKRDIVPHKPAYRVVHYRHSGTEIWYKVDILDPYITSKSESSTCSNSIGSWTHNYSTDDHSSKHYIRIYEKVFGYEGIKEDVVKFIELKREEDLKISNNDGSEWEDK